MIGHLLVPIDASENAERALAFGVDLAARYDADLDVVHITDVETESTRELLASAREVLDASGLGTEPEVKYDLRLTFRAGDRIGDDILELVETEGYDHVVMGHQGAGAVERFVLGSATETVIRADAVAVTVVP